MREPDAHRAWQLLVRFFFAQREHLPSLSAEFELSPVQCHVLHLLEPERPLPMGRLAETLSCDASNVTGLVDRLEARGLVQRRPSSGDRRVKELQLTPAGSRLRPSSCDGSPARRCRWRNCPRVSNATWSGSSRRFSAARILPYRPGRQARSPPAADDRCHYCF